jgi:hypothetical protein
MPPSDDEIKVRLDRELKRAFKRACKARDMTVSQVLRHFMREYVADCAEGAQSDLFDKTPSEPLSAS